MLTFLFPDLSYPHLLSWGFQVILTVFFFIFWTDVTATHAPSYTEKRSDMSRWRVSYELLRATGATLESVLTETSMDKFWLDFCLGPKHN